MIKFTSLSVNSRVDVKNSKADGIQSYDHDNLYPQRIKNIISNSGTASSCINLFAKFILGDGFKDKVFWKTKINETQTVDQLCRLVAQDYAMFKGFAVHVGYNALFEKVEFNHIPFENCRLGEADDNQYAGKVIVYNKWGSGKTNKKQFQSFNIYNPQKEIVAYQIESAGGFDLYRGQVFYFGGQYPKCSLDAVLEDVQTDYEIKQFRLSTATNAFKGDQIIELPYEFASEEEREEVTQEWVNRTGSEAAAKPLLIENPALKEGYGIKFTNLQTKSYDREYEVTVRTVKDSIIECLGQPPILLGVAVAGKLGTSGEIADAFEFYNNYTLQDKRVFEEAFIELCKETSFNPSNDFTISTLNFGATNAKPALIETLGVGGVTALSTILQSPLDPNQKINTLKIVFGLTLEEAQSIVLGTSLQTV